MVNNYILNFTEETNLYDKGVYLIVHTDTNVKYVGSTIEKYGFKGRWSKHLRDIKKGTGNRVLVNIYRKYGIDGFRFSILERMNFHSIKEVRNKELYYINKYDSYNNGANCTLDTMNPLTSTLKRELYSEERKLLYKKSCTTKRPVYVYDIEGNLLYTFESSVDADRFFNLRKGRVSEKCIKELSLNKKYFFSRELKDWCPREILERKNKERGQKTLATHNINGWYTSEETKSKLRNNNPVRKEVDLYTLDGNLIMHFKSLNECDDYLNLTRGATSKVLKGKAKTLKKLYIPKITC